MRSIIFFSIMLAIISLSPPATGFTYWVDSSCTAKPSWATVFPEFWKMAKRSGERLESPTDTDYAAVFKRIFKVDKIDKTIFKNGRDSTRSDTAYNFVHSMLATHPRPA